MSGLSKAAAAKRLADLELLRSKASVAAKALCETDCGAEALADLQRLFTNRRGVSNLDTVYKKKFMIVFDALNAGLRDGLI